MIIREALEMDLPSILSLYGQPDFDNGVVVDLGDAQDFLAIIGRYILTPDIFPALEETARDRTGEIQLTNGLRRLLRDRPIYACEIKGVRHDTGNKLGVLKALVYFALRRPDLAEPFRRYLETLDLKVGSDIAPK
jgi:UTP-glucose-1-phosphate uridylyltransferase